MSDMNDEMGLREEEEFQQQFPPTLRRPRSPFRSTDSLGINMELLGDEFKEDVFTTHFESPRPSTPAIESIDPIHRCIASINGRGCVQFLDDWEDRIYHPGELATEDRYWLWTASSDGLAGRLHVAADNRTWPVPGYGDVSECDNGTEPMAGDLGLVHSGVVRCLFLDLGRTSDFGIEWGTVDEDVLWLNQAAISGQDEGDDTPRIISCRSTLINVCNNSAGSNDGNRPQRYLKLWTIVTP